MYRRLLSGGFSTEDINENISNLSIFDKDLSFISVKSNELDYTQKSDGQHKSTAIRSRSLFPKLNTSIGDISTYDTDATTAYELILRRCAQTEPLPFGQCYSDIALQKCHKIGEGIYGEVFLIKDLITSESTVLKVVPIEGSLIVNGEKQKNFNEILAEIIITMEVSELRTKDVNTTDGFCSLKGVHCVKGRYPDALLESWELFDEQRTSENDNPQIFGEDQLFIVVELANAGKDVESFKFTNAKQSLSIFRQVALSLAVAEKAMQFEHRDLHWGNVLVALTSEKTTTYKINDRTFTVPLHGVKAAIIDFSYSRITVNGQALYTDLGTEETLFTAYGDYQFEMYRLMRKKNLNNWSTYEPYSNILWLHYLLDKMIDVVVYKNTKSKIHNFSLLDLQHYKDTILSYDSINEFVEEFNYFL